MPAQWTGELIGEMHLKGVTAKQLAAEVGWHEKYLSAVMNGHKEPKRAEEKLRAALGRIEFRTHLEREAGTLKEYIGECEAIGPDNSERR